MLQSGYMKNENGHDGDYSEAGSVGDDHHDDPMRAPRHMDDDDGAPMISDMFGTLEFCIDCKGLLHPVVRKNAEEKLFLSYECGDPLHRPRRCDPAAPADVPRHRVDQMDFRTSVLQGLREEDDEEGSAVPDEDARLAEEAKESLFRGWALDPTLMLRIGVPCNQPACDSTDAGLFLHPQVDSQGEDAFVLWYVCHGTGTTACGHIHCPLNEANARNPAD